MKQVNIYTDGGARGNPGPGGFGVVLICGKEERELNGAYAHTTNNRMELLAAITGVEALNAACEVSLFSDSKYLIDTMTKGWLFGWKKKGWVKSDKKPVLNKDLWQRLDAAQQKHTIKWHWVKGHAGHAQNERCDELVHEAIDKAKKDKALLPDQGYLDSQKK